MSLNVTYKVRGPRKKVILLQFTTKMLAFDVRADLPSPDPNYCNQIAFPERLRSQFALN